MAPPAARSRKLVTFPPKGSQVPPRAPARRLDALLAEVVLELDGPVERKAPPTTEAPCAAEDTRMEPQELIPAPDWKQQERPRQHGYEESQASQNTSAATKDWAQLEEELEAAARNGPDAEEQRQRLGESRQRAKARREQRQAAREAAQQREARMQRRLRSEEGVAEKEAPAIRLDDALSLQRELIVGLSDECVQKRLRHLQRSLLQVDPKAFAKECQELILKVQSEVLPKYGIPGGYAGVQRMLREFDKPCIRQNQDFVRNSTDLNRLLFGNSLDGTKDTVDAACLDSAANVQQSEGKERLSEELSRAVYDNQGDKDELCRNGLGASKSLASRLFAEAVAPSEVKLQRPLVKSSAGRELRLREEAASFLSSAGRSVGSRRADRATASRFDGAWEDGEGTVHVIKDSVLRGLRGGAAELTIAHDAQCLLRVGANLFEGKFSTDGRLLWKDGSMWVRRHGSEGESGSSPQVVAAGEGGEGQAQQQGGAANDSGQAQQTGEQAAGRPAAPGQGQATGLEPPAGAGEVPGGGAGGNGPAGGPNPGQPDGGGDPGADPNAWYEEGPPGRIFTQTLPLFHPPEMGFPGNRNATIWKESGMPMMRMQFSTDGTRVKPSTCYSRAAASAHVAGNPWQLVEALREDITKSIGDRNATRFVDAMETMESIISNEKMLKRELNNALGSLSAADKQAAKKFILEAMPYRSKELLEPPSVKDFEVQSVLQEPSWYADWEVQPLWLWPLPVLFAAHQQALLLQPHQTQQPHKWSIGQ